MSSAATVSDAWLAAEAARHGGSLGTDEPDAGLLPSMSAARRSRLRLQPAPARRSATSTSTPPRGTSRCGPAGRRCSGRPARSSRASSGGAWSSSRCRCGRSTWRTAWTAGSRRSATPTAPRWPPPGRATLRGSGRTRLQRRLLRRGPCPAPTARACTSRSRSSRATSRSSCGPPSPTTAGSCSSRRAAASAQDGAYVVVRDGGATTPPGHRCTRPSDVYVDRARRAAHRPRAAALERLGGSPPLQARAGVMTIHTFHLAEVPAAGGGAKALLRPPSAARRTRLDHAECLALMRLGAPTVSPQRMQLRRIAMFAQWQDEARVDRVPGRRPARASPRRRLARPARVPAPLVLPRGLPRPAARAGAWDQDEPVVAVTRRPDAAARGAAVPPLGQARRATRARPPRHHARACRRPGRRGRSRRSRSGGPCATIEEMVHGRSPSPSPSGTLPL